MIVDAQFTCLIVGWFGEYNYSSWESRPTCTYGASAFMLGASQLSLLGPDQSRPLNGWASSRMDMDNSLKIVRSPAKHLISCRYSDEVEVRMIPSFPKKGLTELKWLIKKTPELERGDLAPFKSSQKSILSHPKSSKNGKNLQRNGSSTLYEQQLLFG